MNDTQRNLMQMLRGVKYILHENEADLNTYPPFMPAYADFNTLMDLLEQNAQLQLSYNTGITKAKDAQRTELTDALLLLADKAATYANMEGDDELKLVADINFTDCKRMQEKALVGACTEFVKILNLRMPVNVFYQITQPETDALEAMADAYALMLIKPQKARQDVKEATQNFKDEMQQIRLLLRTRMDRIMRNLHANYPDACDAYLQMRKIKAVGNAKPMMRGIVTDEQGVPVTGMIIQLKELPQRIAKTTATGHFRFIRLEEGTYTLLLKKKGSPVQEVAVHTGVVEVVWRG